MKAVAITLTAKEVVAIRDLWKSSDSNGHDFGFTEDMPNVPKAQRGGLITSLQAKRVIDVDSEVINGYLQVYFTDAGKALFVDFENRDELNPAAIQ